MWLLSNKILMADSGILEGFCDWHCHLLPGVDDGVQDIGETLQILEEWEMLGVETVWLTPHIMEDMPNRPVDLRKGFGALKTRYTGRIKLHLAAEHMMDGLFAERLEQDEVLPIGNSRKQLLVETSYYTPPMNLSEVIDRVKAKGYEPLLAHPERYQYMDKHDYRHWKEMGVRFQLNLISVVGAYGPEVQNKAEWLLKENMYEYSGTDTHAIEQIGLLINSKINKKTARRIKRISASANRLL